MKIFVIILFLFSWQVSISQKLDFIDKRDGKSYKTVKILNQTWMAENVNFKHDSSFIYKNKKINGYVYGQLYTWKIAKNICPTGWHLPTEFEWEILINSIDAPCYSGGKLKTKTHWSYPNKGVGYSVEFNALPAGFYSEKEDFRDLLFKTYFWSQTELNKDSAIVLILKNKSAWASIKHENKQKAFSVRCIKD